MELSSASSRTIAGVRIATSVFFLLFGEYKVAGPAFAHGGFQNYLHEYISSSAVSFYRPVLSGLVLPHAVFFGYAVGLLELLVGISLLNRVLGAARFRPGHSVSGESDSRELVGAGSRCAPVSVLRSPAGYFAIDVAADNFLCR